LDVGTGLEADLVEDLDELIRIVAFLRMSAMRLGTKVLIKSLAASWKPKMCIGSLSSPPGASRRVVVVDGNAVNLDSLLMSEWSGGLLEGSFALLYVLSVQRPTSCRGLVGL
jgi:hypothetical protein